MAVQTPEELVKAVWAKGRSCGREVRRLLRESNENTEMVHNWYKLLNSPLFRSGLKKEVDK
jgi:hypothetical protein